MEQIGSFLASSGDGIDGIKNFFQPQQQPQTFVEEISSQFRMSLTKRIIAFVICIILGGLSIFWSTFFIISPRTFAKFYTFGNLCLLGSTFFLVGPMQQLKNMCAPQRFISSTLYFAALVGTLYTTLILQSMVISMAMIVIQMAAAVWYGASYIPFAQDCLRSTASTILPI
uniref:Vesicle transport protein n=1 Tax=Arcella intermedia TaxID=1963864 RepID=A0A6B2LMT6_9EUKA|eukprot:TRINITY_DN24375_c0_g1_i1.p1 TRINITY_DN24375_c0_g1~~TRINITY_DN24375_c0_g1_i1.p1  ORF type:complete len:171 (-),score=23.43 TRINITY_DN24375_c0_g1_i1:21-533(-)